MSEREDPAVTAAVAAILGARNIHIPDWATAAGRRLVLRRMEEIKRIHYGLCFGSGGPHGFLEINGIIGGYLDACSRLESEGQPWIDCNIHGRPLELTSYECGYIETKLGCMLGRPVRLVFV